MGSFVPLFVARLVESLVTLGAGKVPISNMVPLMLALKILLNSKNNGL